MSDLLDELVAIAIRHAPSADAMRAMRIRAEMGWQPIETAPLTGKVVLAWYPAYGPVAAFYDPKTSRWTPVHEAFPLKGMGEPTHWQEYVSPTATW